MRDPRWTDAELEGAVQRALDAAAPLIADRAIGPYRKRLAALEDLLACYRTGRRPSEGLHRRLEQTRDALATTEEARDV